MTLNDLKQQTEELRSVIAEFDSKVEVSTNFEEPLPTFVALKIALGIIDILIDMREQLDRIEAKIPVIQIDWQPTAWNPGSAVPYAPPVTVPFTPQPIPPATVPTWPTWQRPTSIVEGNTNG